MTPERGRVRTAATTLLFCRGSTLEAAEAVCSGDGIQREDILELLAHLVDKSLVVMQESGGAARYAMLETIREYAREKLVDSGEADTLAASHFEHFFRSITELPIGFAPADLRDSGSSTRTCVRRSMDRSGPERQ